MGSAPKLALFPAAGPESEPFLPCCQRNSSTSISPREQWYCYVRKLSNKRRVNLQVPPPCDTSWPTVRTAAADHKLVSEISNIHVCSVLYKTSRLPQHLCLRMCDFDKINLCLFLYHIFLQWRMLLCRRRTGILPGSHLTAFVTIPLAPSYTTLAPTSPATFPTWSTQRGN